jgi:hypothetical protein
MTTKALIKKLVLVAAFVLLFSSIAYVPKTQAVVSSNQNKAIFFLSNIVKIDLSKYDVKLTEDIHSSSSNESLVYGLHSSLLNQGTAIFRFYDGNLGDCAIYSNFGSLIYSQPSSSLYNLSLRILQGYQKWTDDSQIQGLVKFLENVGSVRNASEVSGNVTYRISAKEGFTTFQFSNTFNNVEYTGVALTVYGTGAVIFDDSRNFLTIGDTSINISQDQAIKLAENYVRNYSYTPTLSNGTKITMSNLNVTGVGSVALGTRTYNPNDNITSDNSVLSPYWHIEVEVSNMDPSGLSGVGVQVSANDGTVVSPILIAKGNFTPLVSALFPSVFLGAIFSLVVFTVLVVIVAVVVLVVLITRKQETKQPSA